MKTPAFLFVSALLVSVSLSLSAESPEILWTTTLSGQIGYAVYPTEDGGFVVGGYKHVDGYRDFYICKTDGDGEVLWEHTYGNGDRSESMSSMIRTSDGGYLLCGTGRKMPLIPALPTSFL